MSESASQPERRAWYQFRISAIAVIPAVLALLILMAPLLLSGTDADRSAYAYAEPVRLWGFRVCGALVIAWLVAMPMRGSRVATTITFSVLVLLCPVGYSMAWMRDLNLPARPGASGNAVTQLERGESNRMRELREDFADDGMIDLERGVGAMDERITELENAAEGANAKEARVMRASASVLREIHDAQARYTVLSNEFLALGGLDMSVGESTVESLDRRIELAKQLVEKDSEILEIFGNIQARYEKAMREEGLGARAARSNAEALAKKANVPLVLRARRLDKAVFVSGARLLELFREYHGRWNVENEMVMFDEDVPDEVIDRCNVLYEEIDANANAMIQVQGKLLGVDAPPLHPEENQAGDDAEGDEGP